jgi:hypothetical protein
MIRRKEGRTFPDGRDARPVTRERQVSSAHRECQWCPRQVAGANRALALVAFLLDDGPYVARTHARCAAAHRDDRRRQARSTLGGSLKPCWTFLPENTKSARSASINWRLIVTFGSSVVHLRITLDP